MFRNTCLEIDINAIKDNIKNIKENYPDYEYYFAVVKDNAYGHGYNVIKSMVEAGINYFAVADLSEALEIRKIDKDTPILCFGYIDPDYLIEAVENNITITICSTDYFDTIKDTDLELKVHIKLNTGMNRIGVKSQESLERIVKEIKNTNLTLEGIYTHFATSGVYDPYYDYQLNKFLELTKNIDLKSIPIVHLFNSLALVKHKKLDFANGVRLGIAMYGYSNNANIPENKLKLVNSKRKIKLLGHKVSEVSVNNNLKLKKTMTLYSEVIYLTTIYPGEFVGYNAVHKAKDTEIIATIPVGHGNGITKAYKYVKINNKKYPIVAVYMDYISVKVDRTVDLYDVAIIIDQDDLTLTDVAKSSDDTVHHLLVSLQGFTIMYKEGIF